MKTLDGDLNQLFEQKDLLKCNGIETVQMGVYPCVADEDVPKALWIIWENRCPGWWHYQEDYIEHGICTSVEFRERLMKEV